ncbi:MAG: hypothetical protein ACLQO7_04440 [Candidatus Bathyarchaeia archaeon]
MNQKIVSVILVSALILSLAATLGTAITVKAIASPTITVTASLTTLCANSPITLTATLSGGSSPVATSIVWHTTSTSSVLGTPTTTSTSTTATSTVTYTDTDTSTTTVSITATYTADGNNNAATSNTVTLTVYNLDFTGDGHVNFNDVIYFAQAYIADHATVPTLNAACDLLNQGTINFNDIVEFVALYETYQGT